MVTIVSRDPGAPPADYIKRSGGIFRDMTIHDFDMARFLLGEEIDTVTAQASVLVDPAIGTEGDYDSASVMLATASGKHATISNSRRATYGYDQRIEVHGSKGAVSAENQRPVSIEIANANGYTRPPLHDFFMTRYLDAYANEIAAFVDDINRELGFLGKRSLRKLTTVLVRPSEDLSRIGADFVRTDVGNPAEVDALVSGTVARYGRLDVMCNNAGVHAAGPLLDTTNDDFERVVAVNFAGIFYGTRAAGRVMAEQGAKVLHVSSPQQPAATRAASDCARSVRSPRGRLTANSTRRTMPRGSRQIRPSRQASPTRVSRPATRISPLLARAAMVPSRASCETRATPRTTPHKQHQKTGERRRPNQVARSCSRRSGTGTRRA